MPTRVYPVIAGSLSLRAARPPTMPASNSVPNSTRPLHGKGKLGKNAKSGIDDGRLPVAGFSGVYAAGAGRGKEYCPGTWLRIDRSSHPWRDDGALLNPSPALH